MSVRIARELLKIARKLVFDEDIIFVRDDDTKEAVFDKIYLEMQKFLGRIRRNEGMETYTGRRDNNTAMEISIGLDDHDAKSAILRDTLKHAEKLGKRMNVKVISSSKVDDAFRHQ